MEELSQLFVQSLDQNCSNETRQEITSQILEFFKNPQIIELLIGICSNPSSDPRAIRFACLKFKSIIKLHWKDHYQSVFPDILQKLMVLLNSLQALELKKWIVDSFKKIVHSASCIVPNLYQYALELFQTGNQNNIIISLEILSLFFPLTTPASSEEYKGFLEASMGPVSEIILASFNPQLNNFAIHAAGCKLLSRLIINCVDSNENLGELFNQMLQIYTASFSQGQNDITNSIQNSLEDAVSAEFHQFQLKTF